MALQASQEAIGLDHAPGRSSRNAAIAVFLLNNGLHPGDPVAVIGHGPGEYWAHLARLQIVAEILESNVSRSAFDFWESGAEIQQRALGILERTGAKAVIADSALATPSRVPPPWKEIGGSSAYVYFFPHIRSEIMQHSFEGRLGYSLTLGEKSSSAASSFLSPIWLASSAATSMLTSLTLSRSRGSTPTLLAVSAIIKKSRRQATNANAPEPIEAGRPIRISKEEHR